jgi:hypothetical protein
MPVVHQFQDDLSALRIQLSILLSNFKKVTLLIWGSTTRQ